ncbi:hypothetical protein QR680_007419 [Steinernema hermaphroditum]|uniref:Transmembrane protein 106 N-terminal domain-containing protein n=1 Tax=Steinernema hermaphroditum TaxID=289476 RepID=A0AA39IFB2_9BILA|nr:hypothetical protein QR680_007419 [Steinernema hermaphroditum]
MLEVGVEDAAAEAGVVDAATEEEDAVAVVDLDRLLPFPRPIWFMLPHSEVQSLPTMSQSLVFLLNLSSALLLLWPRRFNEIRYKAFQNDEEDMEAGASDSEQEERHEYTELLQGSVPCPSCKGSGRVPKEMEQQFVALIPINDERLEPKKTWRWIVGGASSCVILAMAAIFFLLPRPVHVSLPKAPVSRVNVVGKHLNGSESFMTFHFVNAINVTNQNLYPVNVVNASSTIVSDYYPLRQDIVGFGVSNYSMVLASEEVLHFNNTVSISGAQAVQCLGAVSTFSPAYITFSLEIVVVTEIFGHHQKLSFQANQHVCCLPNGDCTIPF